MQVPSHAAAPGSAGATPADTLDAWREWKARCALGRCGPDTRRLLRYFARHRFALYVERIARPIAGPELWADDGRAAWHRFETHMLTARAHSGKVYKKWLFARGRLAEADRPLDAIQGGATLIMRDVVREYLRCEQPPAAAVSLDRPLGTQHGRPLTLGDLLPAAACPETDPGERELEDLAGAEAQREFPCLPRRTRVALLARVLALPFSHPAVESAAGCRKTALHVALRGLAERLAGRLLSDYRDDDRATVLRLAVRAFRALHALAESWGEAPEESCARLFRAAARPAPRGRRGRLRHETAA